MKRIVSVAIASALVMAAAACGSSDSGNENNTGDGTTDIAAAKTLVESAVDLTKLELPVPSDPVDAGKKRVAVIPVGLNSSGGKQAYEFVKEALDVIGWEAGPVMDGQRDPAKIAAHIARATQQGYDAIWLLAADYLDALKGPVEAALKENIAVACVICTPASYTDDVIVSHPDYTKMGELVAAKIIVDSKGKAKVVAFQDPAYPALIQRPKGAADYLKKNCADCTVDVENSSVKELAQPGPPYFLAKLAQSPKGSIDYIVSPLEGAAHAYVTTIKQRGRDEILVSGMDGLPEMMELLRKGDPSVPFSSFAGYEYAVWSTLDLMARKLAGAQLWDGAAGFNTPLITAETVDKFPRTGGFPEGANAFKEKFTQLWSAR